MQLRLSDVDFDNGSVVDPSGRVFHYEGRVFRAISYEYANIYRTFLEADFIQDVFDSGLIETWISEIELEGFDLVVEHRKVPALSSWAEWCSLMIQDATATVCRVNFQLCKHGYVMKDAQPGNVQFIYGKAYWIDFGSIVPLSHHHTTFAFDEFRYHSLLPLYLLSKGYPNLARKIYQEVGKGYLKGLSTRMPFRLFPPKYSVIKRKARDGKTLAALGDLLEYIEGLDVQPLESLWTGYGQGGMPPPDKPSQFNEKATSVFHLLKRLPPGTLLDIAGNKGWYGELAASMGHQVISFDIDDASVCNLYQRVKEKALPILPLTLDFLYPTPPYSIGLGKASSLERLRSDTVLALAIVHHLVFKHNVYFEPIIEIISQYSREYAVIEFVPPEDRYVSEWFSPRYSWYSLENFVIALRRHFKVIEIHDSWPEPRKLILCFKSYLKVKTN